MKNLISIFSGLLLVFLVLSCSPKLSISVNEDNSTNFNFNLTNTESFFSNFSAFMDLSQDNFYDIETLTLGLEELGFENINLSIGKNADLFVSAKLQNYDSINSISRLNSLFSLTEESFTLQIEPQNIIEILTSIPEITDYLDLLMAPIYTGEDLTEQEYLEFFASVYGESFTKDFENTNIYISINTIKDIEKVNSSKDNFAKIDFSKKTVNISIPLYKLLCHKDNSIFKIEF